MNAQQHTTERGQALILVVFGIVALLGFTALAIDGGMVYSDRRHAQNAADAASLAGGAAAALTMENARVHYDTWDCTNNLGGAAITAAKTAAEAAAIARAGNNGFTIDYDITDGHGADARCGTEDNGSWVDKYIDVKVKITSQTKTSFAHFVYGGPMVNTVEAVTRVRPRLPAAFGDAIVATRTDCPNNSTGGVQFQGGVNLNVYGGGIFSNACMVAAGSGNVNVSPPEEGITCTGDGCFTQSGNSGSMNPSVGSGNVPLPSWALNVPEPDCNNLPARGVYNGDGYLEYGRYSSIDITGNMTHTMQSGLFCLDGGNSQNPQDVFKLNGGAIVGNNVTFYVKRGDFNASGNGTVILSAPPANGCGNPCTARGAVGGILVYMDENNSGTVALRGSADNVFEGMVYAPNGTIDAGGTANEYSPINAQLVGNTVIIHGNVTIDLTYDGGLNFNIPASLELYR